jgi:hypothetical protein
MRIVLMHRADWDSLWLELPPAERLLVDNVNGAYCLTMPSRDTLVFVQEELGVLVEILEYDHPAGGEFSLAEFLKRLDASPDARQGTNQQDQQAGG